MSTYQHKRLAAETPKERETRLQQMSTYQHERLAVETPEERETRLQRYRARYREQSAQPQLPLFQQSSVRAKMGKFHASVATLDQYALRAQRDSQASSFTQTLLSVCVVVVTNIFRKYIPLPTT